MRKPVAATYENLTPLSSTAAYVNGDDQAIPLVKIEGPPDYQEHMKQLIADSARRRLAMALSNSIA